MLPVRIEEMGLGLLRAPLWMMLLNNSATENKDGEYVLSEKLQSRRLLHNGRREIVGFTCILEYNICGLSFN